MKYVKQGEKKMDTLLMGNGINIQYARDEIPNKDIILRAIDKATVPVPAALPAAFVPAAFSRCRF